MNTKLMPAIFIGHGSPKNALEDNVYTRSWKKLGQELSKPKAILCISAHWYKEGTSVSDLEHPDLIYDFYGFSDELYQIKYPVAGSLELAKQIKKILEPLSDVSIDNSWGIDHGAWVPIKCLYPEANIPIVELSIDATKPAEFHYQLGQALKTLREQGILIIGSGNIVHNLGYIDFQDKETPYPWALEFDTFVNEMINKSDYQSLINYKSLNESAKLSIPTPEHYLPLLYILGLQNENEKLISVVEGIVYKSISMRSLLLK